LNRIAVLEANRGTWFELWLGIVGEELFSLPEFELDVDDFTEGLAIHTRYALQFMRGVGIGPIWSRGRVEYFDLDTPEGPMRFQRGDNSWREFLRVLFGWETPVRGPRMWPPAATPPPPTFSPPGGDGEHCED
jgi:hypothetical protein